MSPSRLLVAVLVLVSSTLLTPLRAQKDDVVMQPVQIIRLPELSDLIEAKVDDAGDGPQLVVLAEVFRTEKRKGNVTKFRTEQRERTVLLAGGEEVKQTYTIQIPFVEAGEVDVQIPAGRKPVTLPLVACEFYSMTGKRLGLDAVKLTLENLRPILLLDNCQGDMPEIPKIFSQAMQEDCLIVTTSKKVRESKKSTNLRVIGDFAVPRP